MADTLIDLAEVLEQRKGADPEESYVASLYAAGLDKILEKVEEEAGEVVDAAKGGDPEHLVYETADLWFHSMVLLAQMGQGPDDVLRELRRRFGIFGHEEKASRTK